MRTLFVSLFLSLVILSAHAAEADAPSMPSLVTGLRERLIQSAVLRGQFEQNKKISGFKKPLLSRGDFLIVRERGVIWRTLTPFASTLRLTRGEIVAKQDGAVAFRLSASKEPSVRVINGLLFALLKGDVSGLTEQFDVQGNFGKVVDDKNWQLVLTPKSAALAKIMSRIELAGDQFVRRIQIDEANGDQTSIRFSNQRTEPEQLSLEEAAQFD